MWGVVRGLLRGVFPAAERDVVAEQAAERPRAQLARALALRRPSGLGWGRVEVALRRSAAAAFAYAAARPGAGLGRHS